MRAYVCLYMCVYMCVFSPPLHGQNATQRQMFKRSIAGLNSKLLFF